LFNTGEGSDGLSTVIQSPSSPMFTGSLEFRLKAGMQPMTRRLLSLPDGIHFRKLTSTLGSEEDLLLTTALMERCFRTLESLHVTSEFCGTSAWDLCPPR
jgi:hypothetical protein